MTFRYALELAYRGTNYHGWQIQPNASSVQEEIERRLSQLMGNIPQNELKLLQSFNISFFIILRCIGHSNFL